MPFGETSSREQHFKLSNLLTVASATEISVDTRRLAPKKVNEEWTSNFERNLYLGNFEFKSQCCMDKFATFTTRVTQKLHIQLHFTSPRN